MPIEIKWSDHPSLDDTRHLQKFIICRTPKAYEISDKIIALPWQELSIIFDNLRIN